MGSALVAELLNQQNGGLSMSNFKGKVAVVTGAGRGFGAAAIKRFAELGADVVIDDIVFYDETDRLVEEVESLGRRVLRTRADVTNRSEIRQMFKTAYDTFGHIDILVNNAGVSRMKDFEGMTDEDWDFVVDTNLKSMFITTQEVFPYFKMNEKSRIVNLASMSGQLAGPVINYGVSKAGVIQLTKNTARHGAPYNILVNAVAPGIILSEMTREELQTPVGQEQLNLTLFFSLRSSMIILLPIRSTSTAEFSRINQRGNHENQRDYPYRRDCEKP